MKSHRFLAVVITAGLAASSLSAWDACGHLVTAVIAHQRLSPSVQAKVDAVFAHDPRGRSFVDSSTWPDDIKEGKRNEEPKAPLNKPWHYVDIPYFASEAEIAEVLKNRGETVNIHEEKSANVVTAITYYANYLKSGQGTAIEKADALSFLIHYVGDVHQPLHCVTLNGTLPNYTPPEHGDAGGNGFSIRHPSRELHALWDDAFDEPTTGKGGRDRGEAHAQQVAATLRSRFSATDQELALTNPADWARESYSYRTFAYSPPEDPKSRGTKKYHIISSAYLAREQEIAGKRLVLAGDRLAILLQWIYGG
jgi:hypothetical protein